MHITLYYSEIENTIMYKCVFKVISISEFFIYLNFNANKCMYSAEQTRR